MSKSKTSYLFYLLVGLIPIIYYIMYKIDHPKNIPLGGYHFYTSVKSPDISKIEFYKNNDLLNMWQTSFKKYKQIDYLEKNDLKSDKGFSIKISHYNEIDTISFLGINFYINGQLYTLAQNQISQITTSSNARIIHHNSQLKIISEDHNPVDVRFNAPCSWSINSIDNFKKILFLLTCIVFCSLPFIIRPGKKWFLISLTCSLIAMFYYWQIGKDPNAQLSISPCNINKAITFYYNSVPNFKNELSAIYNDSSETMKTQVNTVKHSFYRIDFSDSLQDLTKVQIKYSIGLISKTWHLNSIIPFEMNGNDLDYENGKYSISGNDGYLCLTNVLFNNGFKKVNFVRSNVYMLFTFIIFCTLLLIERYLANIISGGKIIILPFICMIFSSFFYLFVNDEKLVMSEEKRLALPFPQYKNSSSLKIYTKQLDNYFKDQLPGRSQLILINNYSKYKTFSEVANNPLVHFGKNGWMFYTGENVKDVYENKTPYTIEDLKKMTSVLEKRRDWLKAQGISYYLIFPRMSHYFYHEHVGYGIYQYNPKARLEVFLEYLKANSDVNVIDIYTPMYKAKKESKRDLYYQSDSHWNLYGAYFAYTAIINRIKIDYPNLKAPIPLDKIKWHEAESYDADLAQLLSLGSVITRHEFIPINKEINNTTELPIPEYPEYQSVHPMVFYQGKNSDAPKLIMNRDSYSNFLIPYFAPHFSRQGYLWTPIFFPTIIQKEKPDIVITEMMERFLDDLLVENPHLP